MPQHARTLEARSTGSASEGRLNAQKTSNSASPGLPPTNISDEDPNPRSPKRRRLSPSSDDDTFDIGAAAARALALSLGGNVSKLDTTAPPPPPPPQRPQTESRQHTPVQIASALPSKPVHQSRVNGLSDFGNLAEQILVFLARLNHLEIGEMLFGPPSPRGQEYRSLKQKFDEKKQMYIVGASPFLDARVLDLQDTESTDIIRRVNLAIFMASIFSGEIGLRIMDINFIEIFVPEGGRLLKPQGSIYLELKTHAFMAATRTASTLLNQVMMDLFPPDMEQQLLRKRPGAKALAPSEQDFLNRLGSRRDILYSVIRSNKLNTLPDTYRWNDFAREVSIYLTKYMENGTLGTKDAPDNLCLPVADQLSSHEQAERHSMLQSLTSLESDGLSPKALSRPVVSSNGLDLSFDIQAMVAQAARTAALSMGNSIDITLLPPAANIIRTAEVTPACVVEETSGLTNTATKSDDPNNTDPDVTLQMDIQQQSDDTNMPRLASGSNGLQQESNDIPHSSQTAPTQVLYERARQVNTNKALASKKSALPTHRRPWTADEENALMTGLDEVKGPHWSQILAMYGPGGTVNESLKDRNQVQLKDKARNLKLFFLKAGIEVPYYLQAVTGDLKTRAPGQAEKMERERMQGGLGKSLPDDLDAGVDISDLTEMENVDDTDTDQLVTEGSSTKEDLILGKVGSDADLSFDMEAMIARAAASASRGFGPPSRS